MVALPRTVITLKFKMRWFPSSLLRRHSLGSSRNLPPKECLRRRLVSKRRMLFLACTVAQQKDNSKTIQWIEFKIVIDKEETSPSFKSVRFVPKLQAPVVQRLDNAIQRINRYPVDKC